MTSESDTPDEMPVATLPAENSSAISQAQTEQGGLQGLIIFIGSAIEELKKITWPDRAQVLRETLSVIVLVAVITAAVLAFDAALGKVVFNNIDHLARQMGGGIGVRH